MIIKRISAHNDKVFAAAPACLASFRQALPDIPESFSNWHPLADEPGTLAQRGDVGQGVTYMVAGSHGEVAGVHLYAQNQEGEAVLYKLALDLIRHNIGPLPHVFLEAYLEDGSPAAKAFFGGKNGGDVSDFVERDGRILVKRHQRLKSSEPLPPVSVEEYIEYEASINERVDGSINVCNWHFSNYLEWKYPTPEGLRSPYGPSSGWHSPVNRQFVFESLDQGEVQGEILLITERTVTYTDAPEWVWKVIRLAGDHYYDTFKSADEVRRFFNDHLVQIV
jgi:hypothetical protein